MDVLLTRDITRLGKAGEVKKVADGYARNYLIPNGLAVQATQGRLKQVDTIRKAEERRLAQLYAEAQAVAAQLSETTITFRAKAGESGKLYGSITSTQIAEEILSHTGIEIDKRKIEMKEPIRMVGEHKVPVKLAAQLVAEVKVIVEPEREALAQEAQPPSITAEPETTLSAELPVTDQAPEA